MKQKEVKKPLSRRITLQLLALMLAMTAIVGGISYWALRSTYIRMYNEKAQDLVRTLAASIDGNFMETYVRTGETDAYYEEVRELLNRTKENFRGIQYLYLLYPMEDYFIYIVEGTKEGDDPALLSYLGDTFPYGEQAEVYQTVVETRKPLEGINQSGDQGYGSYISTLAPVLDAAGNLTAIVEADCVMDELNATINPYAFRILSVLIVLSLAVISVMILVLRQEVTVPLAGLTKLVRSYEHGATDADLSMFPREDELRYLAGSFQEMTVRIEQYITNLTAVTAEKERISTELNVATQIQADMLPRIFPAFPERKEFDLFASMDPAKEVGGDFYDYFMVDDDHLALVMADVSGKGVPAALFMVIAKTLLKNRVQAGGSPKEILADVNNQLCEGNEAELFVTVWLGILTISTGDLITASAGHEYPAVCHADGQFSLLHDKHGLPLASMEFSRYRETAVKLEHGDALFIYTDGVTEATSADRELFGEDRMLAALNHHCAESPSQILPGVRREIDAFVGDAPQFDDITMLCLRFF